MHRNFNSRDAKRIVHGNGNLLNHVSAKHLHLVAKGWAVQFSLPRKVMLKAMARYARLHHTH